jgi:hypothetical protein
MISTGLVNAQEGYSRLLKRYAVGCCFYTEMPLLRIAQLIWTQSHVVEFSRRML